MLIPLTAFTNAAAHAAVQRSGVAFVWKEIQETFLYFVFILVRLFCYIAGVCAFAYVHHMTSPFYSFPVWTFPQDPLKTNKCLISAGPWANVM